jgi:hypothetical protein
MIKTQAAVLQEAYSSAEVTVSDERRIALSRKGQILYGKYCGTQGAGICAESFAEYHTWRGELIVVRDFLAFLTAQVALLRQESQSNGLNSAQLLMTQRLISRIEALLGEQDPVGSHVD